MDTGECSLQTFVGGATADELRDVLLALEGRVVDVGESINHTAVW